MFSTKVIKFPIGNQKETRGRNHQDDMVIW